MTLMRFSFSARIAAAFALCGGSLACASAAAASEGGGSTYLQGTYNDFSAAVLGPEGVYARRDFTIYDASVGARPLGGRVQIGIDQHIFMGLFKFTYLSDMELLGGRIGSSIVIPLVADADASLTVSGPVNGFVEGERKGFGDLYVVPLLIGWESGKMHYTFAPGVVVPVGKYGVDNAINLGRNYWAIDPSVAVSYLDPEAGIDLSGTAGIMFNFENPDTGYTTGNELHVDFNLSKMLSPKVGLGVTGYYYDQLTDDEGDLPDFARDGFQGRGFGIGPSALVNTRIFKHPVQIIGKAIFDVDTENRFNGDIYMVSLQTKF